MRQNTKAALIHAAERLFAEKGLGAVSVRDITRAAGARNESALHYHFGTMDALVREVFAHRYYQLEEARLARLAEIDAAQKGNDLTSLMGAAIGPIFEACSEEGGRLYAHFLVQLVTDPRFELPALIRDIAPQSVLAIRERVLASLEGLPEDIAVLRLQRAMKIGIVLAADYAHRIEAGTAPPAELAIREASTCLSGFIQGAPT